MGPRRLAEPRVAVAHVPAADERLRPGPDETSPMHPNRLRRGIRVFQAIATRRAARRILGALGFLAAVNAAAAAQTTDVVTHDPVMIRQDDTYYLFATGNGVAVWSSKDMRSWRPEPPVFAAAPAWAAGVAPGFRNHIWAPDIYHHEGRYYLYYSVSAFGRNTSAIGVATNRTLNRQDPEFRWVDHGIVVRSVPGRDMWNAIDPHVMHDETGRPWMSFGSHWGGMKLVRLSEDLLRVAQPEEWYTISARHRYWKLDDRDAGDSANPELKYDSIYPAAILAMNRASQNGAIEAPFIFRKNGYYYQFVSWDRCCRGAESTYKVVVGRSRDITGPYLDREGEDMRFGGGTLVTRGFAESARWAAGGHNSTYTFDGKDYLVFHAYDALDDGKPKLVIREIEWDRAGWPSVWMGD
jgi:arabinan endo-1,5-alpha-L-arabinosidase